MNAIIKWLIKTVLIGTASLLSLIAAVYVVLLILSLQKSPLNAEVEAFLQPEPVAVLPERNGFYYWRGLDAPAGEHPLDYGRRSIAKLSGRLPAVADSQATSAGQNLRLVHDRKILCHPENQAPCLVLARQHAAQVRALAKENAELMFRYAALLRFDQFATDMPVMNPLDPLLSPMPVLDLHALAQTLDAVDVSEGRASEVLKRLAARVGFLRRVHANSTDVIDRSFAQVLLVRDLQFLVEVAVRERDSAMKAAPAYVSVITAPLTAAERSSLQWIRPEFSKKFAWINPGNPSGWQFSICESVLRGNRMEELVLSGNLEERCGGWDMRMLAFVVAPLLDRNAVINQWFETVQQLRQIDGLDTFAYLEHLHKVIAAAESRDEGWRLQNPANRWIAKDVVAGSKSYLIRAIDFDRLFALTRLAVKLTQERIKESEMAAYVQRSDIRDPATKEPFGWDAASNQVYFAPLDP